MTRAYELMIIIDADVDDAAISGILDRVGEWISGREGSVASTDHWGRRRYAYPINKKLEGYYVVLEFTAPPGPLHELERMLRLADEVVRHKLFRLPDSEASRRGLLATAEA